LRLGTLALLLAVALAACGSSSSSQPKLHSTSLILDFTPNAVHAGIYSAIAQRYVRKAGLRLHVIAPTQSTESGLTPSGSPNG